jgi:hypothetical protein
MKSAFYFCLMRHAQGLPACDEKLRKFFRNDGLPKAIPEGAFTAEIYRGK